MRAGKANKAGLGKGRECKGKWGRDGKRRKKLTHREAPPGFANCLHTHFPSHHEPAAVPPTHDCRRYSTQQQAQCSACAQHQPPPTPLNSQASFKTHPSYLRTPAACNFTNTSTSHNRQPIRTATSNIDHKLSLHVSSQLY
eukprot:3964289-Pleurochrysis_carterae.AAC.5